MVRTRALSRVALIDGHHMKSIISTVGITQRMVREWMARQAVLARGVTINGLPIMLRPGGGFFNLHDSMSITSIASSADRRLFW